MSELRLFTGPMYSGKSHALIRELDVASIAEKKVLAVKPRIDTRTRDTIMARRRDPNQPGHFIPHSEFPATILGVNDQDAFEKLIREEKPSVLGIDEVHFFGTWIIDAVFQLLAGDDDIFIVASGLDADFTRNPFPVTAALAPMAIQVNKETAVCFKCKQPALFSQRISGGTDAIEVDASCSADHYEARCARCHTVYVV